MKKYGLLIICMLTVLALALTALAGCTVAPDNGDSGTGDTDNKPETPDAPDLPDTPDEPDAPSEPDVPSEPDIPQQPNDPVKPDDPSDPDEPADPEDPTDPEDPPYVPEGPGEPTELPHVDYSEADNSYYNTELFYRNDYDIGLGDPTVLCQEEDGETWFYVTGTTTGKNFQLWKTKNFTEWISLGTVYTPPEKFFGTSRFWAPQLMYDESADWQYYLGEAAGEGKGLYILFFSARTDDSMFRLGVAFSKTVNGPYTNFVGTNANGDYIDESKSCFEIEKLKGLGLYEGTVYGALYKDKRGFIDASPFVDPVTGDKYLYMVRNRSVDTSNDVWGVKMKDWVSPDYSTTTPLSSYGYTTIEKTEAYNFTTKNKIDEGPFLYYRDTTDDGVDNGLYYLTLSMGDTNDKLYPVCQAIGTSPLGPFEKVQPEDGGFIICPGDLWDIHGSGHHCFFEVGGELFVAHHTYIIKSGASIGSRYFSFSRVEWVEGEGGVPLMRANGPHKTLQPLPSAASKYTNVATGAEVSVNGTSANLLADGVIALSKDDAEREFILRDGDVVTIKFDTPTVVRAILIYNSYDFDKAFRSISRIELEYYKEIDGKLYRGVAYINELGFSLSANLVPASYLTGVGSKETHVIRPMGAAIAEFDELAVSSIKIYFNTTDGQESVASSEIVVLGRESDVDMEKYRGDEITYTFPEYTAFVPKPTTTVKLDGGVKLDGVLDDAIWQSPDSSCTIAGVTKDQTTGKPIDVDVWGERHAKVYTYIGEETVYIAFDVTDPNLFCNVSQPQGRSSGVEIYITTKDNTVFGTGCYSIRINPTGYDGDIAYRFGAYVPKADGSEWTAADVGTAVAVAVKVHGSVVNTANGVRDPNTTGYTVEIAISRALLGMDDDSFRFTAAFVQDQGYDLQRLGNSFITGTHYMKPEGWIVVEKKSYIGGDEDDGTDTPTVEWPAN